MGIFNNINKDTLNGLSLTKLNNDNIRISPGQISLGSTIMTLNESVDLALSGNLMNGESENASKYYYLYAYNGKKPDVDEYTKLLIHSDDVESDPISFVDSSDSGHVITANGNVNHSVTSNYTPNLLVGGTPSAVGSYNGTVTPDKAVDGDLGTRWQINTAAPWWWKYDFGAGNEKTICKLRLVGYGANYGVNAFILQGSNNNSNWDNIYSGNGENCTFNYWMDDFNFENSVAYRYYRLWINSNHGGGSAILVPEVEMMEHVDCVNKFGESAIYFDGDGDYLTIPDSDDWNFGSSDFTIDFWSYITSYDAGAIVHVNPISGAAAVGIVLQPDGYLAIYAIATSGTGSWPIFGGKFPEECPYGNQLNGGKTHTLTPLNEFFHFALTKSNHTWRMFINGINVWELYLVHTCYYTDTGIRIANDFGINYFNGYIEEIRVSNNARWTENFTPDTSPYTPDINTKLLIHSNLKTDNLFLDSSESGHTITKNGDTFHSVSEKKFGQSSMYFDGVGDYLSIPDSEDFNFGSGDFTVDCWIRPTSLVGWNRIFVTMTSSAASRSLYFVLNENKLHFAYSINGSSFHADVTSVGTIDINTWTHVAIVRDGATIKLFIDGLLDVNTLGISTLSIYNSEALFGIGGCSHPDEYYNGYIDEFRISKGIARWTENFTPDTSPYIIEDPPENNLKFKYSAVKPTKDQYSNTVTNYNSRRNSSLIHPTRSDMKYIGNILNNSNGNIESVRYGISNGGIITFNGDYIIHTFIESGILEVADFITSEVLVVAGGGSGGSSYGGGGGGGGILFHNAKKLVKYKSYQIIVGDGGIGNGGIGNNGENSVFDDLIALGGGAGGFGNNISALSGGCGGGGGGYGYTVGASALQENINGAIGYGYNGGNGTNVQKAAGGGGGAGGIGNSSSGSVAGMGGNGKDFSISGNLIYYGGGGGGGAGYNGSEGTAANGGLGGGGNGSNNGIGQNGEINMGGGGGGSSQFQPGSNGGSGIVIIKYHI